MTNANNLLQQVEDALKNESDTKILDAGKSALKAVRAATAKRDLWIERRTAEKAELVELEKQVGDAIVARDLKKLKELEIKVRAVGLTDSLDGYQEKYGKPGSAKYRNHHTRVERDDEEDYN